MVKQVVGIFAKRTFQDKRIFGQHIERENFRPAVVVHIGNFDAHGKLAGMHERFPAHFFEGSVALVDIEVIIFVKIIANVQIRVAVVVYIACHYAQTVADHVA